MAENVENQQPSLPDQYVTLLEEVKEGNKKNLDENRALRQALAARNETLERLEAKLASMQANPTIPAGQIRGRQRRPVRVQVPLICRVRISKAYNRFDKRSIVNY